MTTADGTYQSGSTNPSVNPRKSGLGTAWVTLLLSAVVLVVLLFFILQNMNDIAVKFMNWTWTLPAGIALLLAAVAGGLVMSLLAGFRVLQLRRINKAFERAGYKYTAKHGR
ncbi:MAG: DUF1049 domain-containing protein [Mycobacteriaceae bacterium]|nr:DUF1049 domain-containing protein [Mycobacteriaceae bacterium]